MQLTAPHPLLRRRRRSRPAPAPSRPRQGATSAEARARQGGGPQDHALYSCECGFAFKAEVTTSVGCPHCGTQQAW